MTRPEHLMYFGTKERKTWLVAPAPGAGFTADAWTGSMKYLNGGAKQRNSTNAHMEYNMTWGSITLDEVAQYEDYAFKLYGEGLNYWLDPTAMERNLFNRAWAAPKITAEDGISLVLGVRPALVTVGDLSQNYPLQGAAYGITAGQVAREFYIPLPPGYTLWFGAHGTTATDAFTLQPMLGASNSGSAVSADMLAVNTSTRFNVSVDGSGTVDGVSIKMDTASTRTLQIAGLMAQVLPTGKTPETGGFISGRGNSGCTFDGKPNVIVYSIPGRSNGMTAKLIEVGDWQ